MYEFTDNDLGKIIVKPNRRAKNIIARKKTGHVQLTVPHGFDARNLPRVLSDLKPKLLAMKAVVPFEIDENSVIRTFSFDVRFQRTRMVETLQMALKNGKLRIFLPEETDFGAPVFRKMLKESIVRVLRLEAKRILPAKAAFFAQKHRLSYQSVRINAGKSRWGSCSVQKHINFSLFLLLLPEKFIDYVVLHELAHTVEMNHGPAFWTLLDSLCGCRAKALSLELKAHTPESYTWLTQSC